MTFKLSIWTFMLFLSYKVSIRIPLFWVVETYFWGNSPFLGLVKTGFNLKFINDTALLKNIDIFLPVNLNILELF
jgi:hypothetical protein